MKTSHWIYFIFLSVFLGSLSILGAMAVVKVIYDAVHP